VSNPAGRRVAALLADSTLLEVDQGVTRQHAVAAQRM
jgi:hypothetical protein